MSQQYTSLFTVWKAGKPDVNYGDIIYETPTVFKGLFRQGGTLKLTDKMGQEFNPSSTYWSRLEVVSGDGFIPSNDDLIIRGDHRMIADPTEVEVQQIRGQTLHDNSMFGEPIDYIFGTK